ncbi:hypothetical protein MMC19_000289 [Ptychographa xylographoides]|nr:hypothetical protein [Ptychographa xylographoides]
MLPEAVAGIPEGSAIPLVVVGIMPETIGSVVVGIKPDTIGIEVNGVRLDTNGIDDDMPVGIIPEAIGKLDTAETPPAATQAVDAHASQVCGVRLQTWPAGQIGHSGAMVGHCWHRLNSEFHIEAIATSLL